jgi:hypothetical protein
LDDDGGQGAGLLMSSRGSSSSDQPLATGNDTVLVGVWPGSHSPHLPNFFACHFQGDWESYLPFGVWADDCEMENLDRIILLEEWLDSLLDDGGGTQSASTTPAMQVGDPDILPGTARWGSDGDIGMSIY